MLRNLGIVRVTLSFSLHAVNYAGKNMQVHTRHICLPMLAAQVTHQTPLHALSAFFYVDSIIGQPKSRLLWHVIKYCLIFMALFPSL